MHTVQHDAPSDSPPASARTSGVTKKAAENRNDDGPRSLADSHGDAQSGANSRPQDQAQAREWVSWNENVRHRFRVLHQPRTESEIAALVRDAAAGVRVIGTGRSSADIVAGTDTLLDLTQHYNQVVHINRDKLEITVQSGMLLIDLIKALEAEGWCLSALPDIDCISVGGAIATGTHGTGRSAFSLSGYVVGMRMVLADGTIREIASDDAELDAFRLSLGVLGVISTITFCAEPLYSLWITEGPERDAHWLRHHREWLKVHEFLRILWLPHTGHAYVIKGNRLHSGDTHEKVPAPTWIKHRRTVSSFLYQRSIRFPWVTMLVNRLLFALFFAHRSASTGTLYDVTVTKSRGSTMELAEWTIDIDAFPAAFAELKQELQALKNPAFAHIPMDVRFLKQESSWLACAYGADIVTIGCVCRVASAANQFAAFALIERIFTKHGGRPHWGKRHTWTTKQCAHAWPRFADFLSLRDKLDPQGKFLNGYLAKLFGAAQ